MLNRFLPRPITIGVFSLFLLTAATVASILVPAVSSAGNESTVDVVLRTATDNVLRLSATTNEIIYNPQDQMIYATRPSSIGSDGNSVTRINPLNGAVGASVYVGSEPNKLALSDNGQTLYVTLDGAYAIRRYDISTQTPGIQFSVGRGQSVNANDAPYVAGDVAVAPGNPDLLAVARDRPGISPPGAGVAVFNNGVQLPQTGPGHSASANYLAFSSSATTLYGGGYYQEGLRTLTITASGVVDNTGSGTPFEVRKLKFENNLLFTSTGLIINPQTRMLLGTCPGVDTNAFVPDTATGRVFYAMKDSSAPTITIRAFDINSFTQVGSLTIPDVGFDLFPTTLLRFGTNGLAMRTSDNKIYFIQTALIPTANPLPAPSGTPSVTPTPTAAVYTNFIRSVTLPNRDLIYSRTEQKFYASVPGSAPAPRANSVTRINPTSGMLESSVIVGSQPGRLAFSDDDQMLYVGIDGANAVRKFDVATQTPGLQFPLGIGVNGPKIAYDIDVLPGNSNAVAVSYGSTCYNYDGADIYDNGIKRAQKANASGQINIASPDTLYVGENYVYKYGISANGLSLQENFSTGSAGESVLVGNLLYTSGGGVLNLTTKEFNGSFTGIGYWAGLTVDAPNNRIFFLVNLSTGIPSWTLKAYRLDNFLPVGSIPLPGVSLSFPYCESPHRLIRWGANGLAFHDNNNKIYFIQSDLISASGAIPSAVQFNSQNYNGNEGNGNLPVTVTRTGGLTGTVTVNYVTQDGTAIAGADYTATTGTLIFAPGEASKTINIPLINDTIFEGNETFSIVLSNPGGDGTVEVQSPSAAFLSIVDNDSQPGISSPNISVNEPPSGTSTALFTVQLSNPTTQTATVNYATVNGTATAGGDYVATSGTLVFAPLEMTKTIAVQILADNNFNEPNETFRINFSNAVNTFINNSQVTATIINYNPQTARRVRFDFDGDGKADISVFRPDNGTWYLQQSTNGFAGLTFGLGTDKLVPADYDGDGKTDVAVFRDGTWYLQRSSLGFTGVSFGASNDIPVPADYDGDGKADIAVFRPSNGTWYLQQSTAGFIGIAFGQAGDKPIAADYDGDGKTDIAVFRSGIWYLNRSQLGFTGIAFGNPDDKLIPDDYDGDGKSDVAVFRPSNGTWYLQRSQLGFTDVQFGLAADSPVPADYDGDGKTDVAVFRDGNWYLNRSAQGFTGVAFGAATDKPVPNAFITQ